MQHHSIANIAAICGVSKATVSRVINNKDAGVGEDTKKRVLKTIAEIGYRPNTLARSVATSCSGIVGVVVPDICNMFYPTQVRAIGDKLKESGYSVFLGNSDFDPLLERDQLLSMVDRRVDGIILCSGVSNEGFLKDFRKYNIPIVMIGRNFDQHLCDASISSDSERGAMNATNHLVVGGNKKILYLDGTAGVSGAMHRSRGYKNALTDAGIPIDKQLMHFGHFTIEFGHQKVSELIAAGVSFSAIFAGSDMIAIGALKALKEAGIEVPASVEVIGFDGIELSSIYAPAISTVIKPRREMAHQAVTMLLSVINNEQGGMRHLSVVPVLELRETTK